MELVWIDSRHAVPNDAPNVQITFAEESTEGLMDLVLSMLLHQKYES